MKFKELENKLNLLIQNNATDKELDEFIEEIAYNEEITNKEYETLLYKAQNIRRI